MKFHFADSRRLRVGHRHVPFDAVEVVVRCLRACLPDSKNDAHVSNFDLVNE